MRVIDHTICPTEMVVRYMRSVKSDLGGMLTIFQVVAAGKGRWPIPPVLRKITSRYPIHA